MPFLAPDAAKMAQNTKKGPPDLFSPPTQLIRKGLASQSLSATSKQCFEQSTTVLKINRVKSIQLLRSWILFCQNLILKVKLGMIEGMIFHEWMELFKC